MSLPTLNFVKPADFSAQFAFVSGAWKVLATSADTGNVLVQGADNGAKLTPAIIKANQGVTTYTVDNVNHQLTITDWNNQSTIVPLGQADIHVTGASLSGTVLTLTESAGGSPVSIDLGSFLQAVGLANSNAVSLSGAGTAASRLSASLIVDPVAGNILKVTGTGVAVNTADILAIINANTTVNAVVDKVAGTLTITVNGVSKAVALTGICSSDGTLQALALTLP